jgi:hypothetical protein
MKDQIEMFPTLTGEQLRDRALTQVGENAGPWKTKALLTSLYELERRHGQRMNGERLRHILVDKIGEPHDPHAWGALVMDIRRKFPGLLIKSGTEKPTDLASHASEKPSYIINANWRGQ